MRKLLLIPCMILMLPLYSAAQDDGKEYKLTSDRLDKQSSELDQQILTINKNISNIIKKYELLKTPEIRILPYQTTYDLGADYIQIEKHVFIKDPLFPTKVTGIKKKRIKIYTNGQAISKIESTIYEKDFDSGNVNEVNIIDPSPETLDTNDIVFSHTYGNKVLLENRKFGDIKNTTAHAVRNEIKQNFLVPHLAIFYDVILFVSSSYYKSVKDSDTNMLDFLIKSYNY